MIERLGLRSIVASLKLHPGNVIVIALQIVVAMVVICNALYIAVGRIEHVGQPSGIREERLLSVYSGRVGTPVGEEQRAASIEEDLARLRTLPGVTSVTQTFSLPLSGATVGGGAAITSPSDENRPVSYFFADPAAIDTLGLKLLVGRNFGPDDMTLGNSAADRSGPAIITAALATRLYGAPEAALGKTLFLNGGKSARLITGVVDRMEIPSVHSEETLANWYTVLLPVRYVGDTVNYVVRSSSGDMDTLRKRVVDALFAVDPTRVIDEQDVSTFEAMRDAAFGADVATARIMLTVVTVLLIITSAGVYGLVSSWIARRTRAIGIRRALGATRRDIVVLLQTENLLISLPAAVLGGALALYASSWLMRFLAGGQLPVLYAVWGALIVLIVSQLAVVVPAVLAAKAPPAAVMRRN